MDEAVLEPIDLEPIPLGSLDEYERPELTPERRVRRRRYVRLGAWGFVVLLALGVVCTPIVGASSVASPASSHLVVPADVPPRSSGPSPIWVGERSFIDQRRGFGLATDFGVPPHEWTADGPDSLFVTRFVVTTDGGKSWSYVGRRVQEATGVAFIDAQHGVLAADGRGLRFTTDGGRHWKQTRQILRSVVASGNAIWAVGYTSCTRRPECDDEVLRSRDGGRSWTHAAPRRAPVTDLVVATAAVAYVSDAGGWSSTVDGGASWRTMRSPCPAAATLFLSPDGRDDLWASCLIASMRDCCTPEPTTYRSHDRGRTWRRSKRAVSGTVVLSESSHW